MKGLIGHVSYKLCQWMQHLWNTVYWNCDDPDLSFLRFSKFQDQEINWITKYDFLYMYHTNFDHNMHHLGDSLKNSITLNWSLMSSKVKRHHMCFMFHINFYHITHNIWERAHWKLKDLDLTFQDNQRSWGQLKGNILLHICVSNKLWS